MTAANWSEAVGIVPARILVVGDDLLTGALARCSSAHGFSTMHVPRRGPGGGQGIGWRPSLVIFDAGSLEPEVGAALVGSFCRAGLRVCVIDAGGQANRLRVWNVCGVAAFVDRNAPFDELVNGQPAPREGVARAFSATRVGFPGAELSGVAVDSPLEPFALLTKRGAVRPGRADRRSLR